jgi:hypothetical protein
LPFREVLEIVPIVELVLGDIGEICLPACVMTVEAMVGLTLLAVSAGLVLARFTRPTAGVMFSKGRRRNSL